MEPDVGRDDALGRPVLPDCRRAKLLHGLLERPQVDLAVLLDEPPRGPDLDRLARDVDVQPVDERQRGHEGAAVELRLDEALLDEVADRLADGSAARPEHACEAHLPEPRALRDLALDDRPAQGVMDLLGRGGALDGGKEPAFAHHRVSD